MRILDDKGHPFGTPPPPTMCADIWGNEMLRVYKAATAVQKALIRIEVPKTCRDYWKTPPDGKAKKDTISF